MHGPQQKVVVQHTAVIGNWFKYGTWYNYCK